MENAVQVTTRELQCAVFRLQPLLFLKAQLKKKYFKIFHYLDSKSNFVIYLMVCFLWRHSKVRSPGIGTDESK